MNHLVLHIGPMFSFKTTELCKDMKRHKIANKSCVIVKYQGDTRYDHLIQTGGIATHDVVECVDIPVIVCGEYLNVLYDVLKKYDVIGIDEVQFFTDGAEVANKLANAGRVVICAGLDGDYLAQPFETVSKLLPLTEIVIKHHAVCMKCFADNAIFTHRLSSANERVVIGGSDMYIPLCRECRWKI